MPKRDTAPIGAPCWIDLFTTDPETSRAFYTRLFGWTAEEADEEHGGYFNFTKDGVHVAGCMRNDGQQGMPDVWSVYLATDNAKETVAAAEANGGGVIVPATEVADLGSFAVVTDAGQAVIGMWQPGLHKGFQVLNEPGAPAWFQLNARDYDASVRFYRDVFGWDTHVMSDTPEFRYTTLGEGDSALAGIMDSTGFLPEGVPAHWSIIFAVENTDDALATIVDLGGSVVTPAADTPYGRLAQAADSTGARFDIITLP
jgi:hypothetical protein